MNTEQLANETKVKLLEFFTANNWQPAKRKELETLLGMSMLYFTTYYGSKYPLRQFKSNGESCYEPSSALKEMQD